MALNEEQIQKVRATLQTSGWNDVMRPAIENRGRLALRALALSRSERAKEFGGTDQDTDDDILRAMIRDATWMTSVWTNEIAVFEHNRKLDELERQERTKDGGATPNG